MANQEQQRANIDNLRQLAIGNPGFHHGTYFRVLIADVLTNLVGDSLKRADGDIGVIFRMIEKWDAVNMINATLAVGLVTIAIGWLLFKGGQFALGIAERNGDEMSKRFPPVE